MCGKQAGRVTASEHDQVLVKVLLKALEWGGLIPACKVRDVVR